MHMTEINANVTPTNKKKVQEKVQKKNLDDKIENNIWNLEKKIWEWEYNWTEDTESTMGQIQKR